MFVLTLKSLECSKTEDWTKADTARLEITADGTLIGTQSREIDTGERWLLEMDIPFTNSVKIKLFDEDWPDAADFLGEVVISNHLIHRGSGRFTRDEADYTLWYEVRPAGQNSVNFHRPKAISIRAMFERIGRGVLTPAQQFELTKGAIIYRASQTISIRGVMQVHNTQDGQRGPVESVRKWILKHCNAFSEETLIPVRSSPTGFGYVDIGLNDKPNWTPVIDENSYRFEGYQLSSRHSRTDYMARHDTMDWNWDMLADPQFMYMLAYTNESHKMNDGNLVPMIECEWETGSMPLQWRPFWGEHVTVIGRHIFDRGHTPVKTEVHPAHSIVRQFTTAAPMGDNNALVPVNRAIIGMGASGGYPHHIGSRWRDETGQDLPNELDIPVLSTKFGNAWATDLRRHPLHFKLFPPVPKPNATAKLRGRIVLAQVSQSENWFDALLSLRNDWAQMASQNASPDLRPRLVEHKDGYYDVTIDLASASGIPAGYYAIIECGWSERGSHSITQWNVNFSALKAVEISDFESSDWQLFYGVNGQWSAMLTSDSIEEGKSYQRNTRFRVFTIDNQPLLLRDAGIDMNWNRPFVDYIEGVNLDRIEINATAPDYFASITQHSGVSVVHRTDKELTIQVRAWEMEVTGGQPDNDNRNKHEWTIELKRAAV